jgi:ribonuclease HI
MRDFCILKKFNIKIHPPKPPSIKEVIWSPPPLGWLKCNSDGAFDTITASCGGIFRNQQADFVIAFAERIRFKSAFLAELCGVMRSIELAKDKNWLNPWIETDSSLVVQAFKSKTVIPWAVRNRWENCLLMITQMNFMISHIYREGNDIADSLANVGNSIDNVLYFNEPPSCILNSLYRNKLGLPSYRFTSF